MEGESINKMTCPITPCSIISDFEASALSHCVLEWLSFCTTIPGLDPLLTLRNSCLFWNQSYIPINCSFSTLISLLGCIFYLQVNFLECLLYRVKCSLKNLNLLPEWVDSFNWTNDWLPFQLIWFAQLVNLLNWASRVHVQVDSSLETWTYLWQIASISLLSWFHFGNRFHIVESISS